MITLSVTTGHAIKALTCLESGECVPRQVSDIAHCTGVPRAYLAKIFNTLSQAGVVQTKRGYHGGVSLARCADQISLRQIIEAVEGQEWIAECLLGMDACEALTVCPTHDFWTRIRGEIIAELDAVTLAELIRCRNTNSRQSPCSCGDKRSSRRATLSVNS